MGGMTIKGGLLGQKKAGYIVESFYKLGIWSNANPRGQNIST